MAKITLETLKGSSYKKINPLPPNNPAQAGPNCGVYALSYVLRHWQLKLKDTTAAIDEPAPARKLDVEGAVKLPADDPNKKQSLRQIAKAIYANGTDIHPLTFIGELFSAKALVEVAKAAQFEAKVHKPALKDYVKTLFKLIDANHPAIVSLDVDSDIHAGGSPGPRHGCPGQFGGEHAHWAVIVGYELGWFFDDLVMFHWENYFQFSANDLRDSANQLIRFSGQTWYKPKETAEQLMRNETGEAKQFYQLDSHKRPLKHLPTVTRSTQRGKHWQKLDLGSVPSHAAEAAWNDGDPLTYANRSQTTPPILSTKCSGVVVQTVFKNTNLDLQNVIIEVVPKNTAFAKIA